MQCIILLLQIGHHFVVFCCVTVSVCVSQGGLYEHSLFAVEDVSGMGVCLPGRPMLVNTHH